MSTENSVEVVEEVNEAVEEVVVEKPYTLRGLVSKDVFLMSKIVSKIGINEFSKVFEAQEVRKLTTSFLKQNMKTETEDSAEDNTGEVAESEEDNRMVVGIGIAMEIANILFVNIGECESELYSFLSNLSGFTNEEVMELPMNVFLEMIVDVCKKDEFKDFIKVVSKLVK